MNKKKKGKLFSIADDKWFIIISDKNKGSMFNKRLKIYHQTLTTKMTFGNLKIETQ